MAIELTSENQLQQDSASEHHARMLELEAVRQESQAANSKLQTKLELIKHAKEVLIANRSNAPVGEREITDEEIVKYATTLQTFLNN